MIKYCFKKIDREGIVYSVDSVILDFCISFSRYNDFVNWISGVNLVHVSDFPANTDLSKYHFMWKFDYPDGSMTLLLQHNSKRPSEAKYFGRLDFNPNKVFCPQFLEDFNTLRSFCSKIGGLSIKRCDIAMDIPIPFENFVLVKDHRHKESIVYSPQNSTFALGPRSKPGRVKLYNKQIESKLDYPLTRLELTCEPSLDSYKSFFPTVYVISSNSQLPLPVDLNDTDKVILELFNLAVQGGFKEDAFDCIKKLGRVKKEKISKFALTDSSLLLPDFTFVSELFAELIKFCGTYL